MAKKSNLPRDFYSAELNLGRGSYGVVVYGGTGWGTPPGWTTERNLTTVGPEFHRVSFRDDNSISFMRLLRSFLGFLRVPILDNFFPFLEKVLKESG